jgi:hypothetical protein
LPPISDQPEPMRNREKRGTRRRWNGRVSLQEQKFTFSLFLFLFVSYFYFFSFSISSFYLFIYFFFLFISFFLLFFISFFLLFLFYFFLSIFLSPFHFPSLPRPPNTATSMLERVNDFLLQHQAQINSIESSLRTLTYVLPGRLTFLFLITYSDIYAC